MIAALLVFGYVVAVAWWLPTVLAPLTATGTGARLGMAAWLTAMVSVLVSAGVAVAFLIRSAVMGWSTFAAAVCRSVAGNACLPVVYRSALYELGLALAAVLATLTTLVLAWRYGRRVQLAQRRTRAHGEAARIAGRRPPATVNGVAASVVAESGIVVLDAPQLAAYCVPGRPGTIVVTSATLAVLEPAQLAAVLAHERAHLAGRHHVIIALTRGLAAILPGVPLFTRGPGEVSRLAEMRADDDASRRAGRRPLIEALVAMGTAIPVAPAAALAGAPAAALPAAGYAVAARVERLLDPPRRARRIWHGLALLAMLLVLPVISGLIVTLAGGS
jgi:Zn-dependent protease with chaperone function